jgi:hypothetical protein
MKRKRLRKRSRTPLAKAKEKLWRALKNVIHKRDNSVCITCGKENLTGPNRHAGHFLPSAACGGFLRYDIRNVWSQCARCNLFESGAGAEYTRALEKKFSRSFVDQIIKDKQETIKLDLDYIVRLTEYYEQLSDSTPKKLMSFTKDYKGFH